MTGLNIDIVKILLLWNVLSVYKNVSESGQRGTFKLANPIHEHRTERQSGQLSDLTFLTAGLKFVYTCTNNFCVNTGFSLVYRFLNKIKSLKQGPGDSCVLILSLTLTLKLCGTWSY